MTDVNTAELTPLKRALLSIETLRDRVRELEAQRTQPIAIVGIGCRLPGGGNTPARFFELLREGREAIRARPAVPRPGWPEDDADLPPAGYLDDDVSAFDAAFFGISPREAMSIDPQHRLLLECVWEALEQAGIDPRTLAGTRTGVFVGMAANDYANMQLRSPRIEQLLNSHFASGTGHSMVSGRLSYLLGLYGPSITVDTACSSSMVALHLACQSLRAGESEVAIAAGVNLILATDYTTAFHQARMLAPDGRCKTFDAAADGFSRGEGCGVLVLKPLADAQRDGDPILAVIRATAVNQDGPSSGLTAPNGPAQEAVIRAALKQAGLQPSDIAYVEAHGTGTSLGDPIEVQALGAVYGADRPADRPLLIGSVKTNIGHVEAAAGIAGVIKVVESLRHKEIPASLHFRTPNPLIPWNELPIAVPTELMPFEPINGVRRAGVSSFGFSGTNAHVILEEAPARDAPPDTAERASVLTLSAADADALRAFSERISHHLADDDNRFIDVCHTLNTGRAHLPHRLAVVADNGQEARELLAGWRDGERDQRVRHGYLRTTEPPALAFLFTGQGSQYTGMGWALRAISPVVRDVLDRCDEVLRTELEVPLLQVLDPAGRYPELINRTDYTQPAIFAVQVALAELWRSWGVHPAVVLGHSIGEYAAAWMAGVFSLEDALRAVATRGRLMQQAGQNGRMVAVMTEEPRVREWVDAINAPVSIAAVNAPTQIVVSGSADAVAEVERLAAAAGVQTKPLRTSNAFHSPLMDDAVPAFEAVLRNLSLRPADRVRFVSTVTGAAVAPETLADPTYWANQIRQPVRFADAVRAAAALATCGVEVGPHPTLSALASLCGITMPVHPSLHREKDAWPTMLTTAAELYVSGVPVAWKSLDPERPAQRIELPRYPFQRTQLWVDLGASHTRSVRRGDHPLLGAKIPQPPPTVAFESVLDVDSPAFIGDHNVLGRAILPGTAYLEMALAGGARALKTAVDLQDIELIESMAFDGGARIVHTRIDTKTGAFTIHSAPADDADPEWSLHCTGHVTRRNTASAGRIDVDAARARCSTRIDADTFAAQLVQRGYNFGPRLLGVREVLSTAGEAVGRVALPEACANDPVGYVAHPLLLDAAVQTIGAAMPEASAGKTWVPVAITSVAVYGALTDSAVVHARVESAEPEVLRASVTLADEAGTVLVQLDGMVFRAIQAADLHGTTEDPFLEVQWAPVRDSDPEHVRRQRAEYLSLATDTLRAEGEAADVASYDRFVDKLEARSLEFAVRALRELGWKPAPGDAVTTTDLAGSLGVVPTRMRLFHRILEMLAEEGILERAGGAWIVRRVLEDGPAAANVSANGAMPAESVLLERCGPKLAEMLRGIGDPLELLFPGGGADDAEKMYYDAPFARTFNRTIAKLVETMRPRGDRKLRILEVGAGTGGTTRRVLEYLDAQGVAFDYTFTDISPLFLERARRRWADRGDITYRTFDLDRDAEEQGFDARAYDIVIAANCLHAARDLRNALANVRKLLKPAGALLAVEVFGAHRWFDLTVGLTDGWWHFTDTDLRPTYACIKPAQWESVLGGIGYTDARAIPLANDDAAGYASRNQGLVIAYRGAVPVTPENNWLILGDARLTTAVAERLGGRGCTVVQPGLDAGARDLEVLLQQHARWDGVVFVTDAWSAADKNAAIRASVEPMLALAKLLGRGAAAVDRVCVVSRAAQVVCSSDVDVDAASATLWGVARTFELELPEVRVDCLDLDATPTETDADLVSEWLLEAPAERELADRFGELHERRLVRREARKPVLPAEYRLARPAKASLDELVFSEGARRQPAAGEVEIRVVASGVNFKDVLNVLGMYPGDAGPLGSECAGIVTAVGPGVDIAVGTPVIASTGHAYGRHVIARAELVAPKPAHLTFAQAAAVPVAYLTAHFALNHLAKIGPGDRVLIHAAAGGVGMAACALARRAGAEVFATAGSEAKRARLRAAGIRHVFDSRSASFADGVRAATNGAGVTVVLNSLADDLIGASFDVLANGGRFLEIGKRGIWTHEQVAALGKGIEYHVIDWGQTASAEPALVGKLFADVMQDVAVGELPPLPVKVFPLQRIADAFRYMAAGRHTGKIVLAHPVHADAEPLRFEADGVYLITGGTAGLGLSTARWAVTQGARELVLVSRSGENAQTREFVEAAAKDGVRVHVFAADVGDASAVANVLRALRERGITRIAGFIHSAGALADRTLQHAAWTDFERVLHAKVSGTLNLAEAARAMRSDFVVCYASIASVLGAPGQANHAAANAFQDTFSAALFAQGVRGMTIGWGPWSETGAATAEEVLNRARERGVTGLTTREGLRWTERAFVRPAVHLVGAKVGDADVLARASRHLVVNLPATRTAAKAPMTNGAAPVNTQVRLTAEIAAAPVDARRTLMLDRVRERIRRVLGLPKTAVVEPDRPLGDLGLDSLLAVELRNVLAEDVERRLPATLLFDHATAASLADHLLELIAPEETIAEAETSEEPGLVGLVESLDDDEVERLLAEKLKQS